MKKSLVALIALIVVSACGADGPPIRPTASAGVSIGPNGVSPRVGVGATNGTFAVGLGL